MQPPAVREAQEDDIVTIVKFISLIIQQTEAKEELPPEERQNLSEGVAAIVKDKNGAKGKMWVAVDVNKEEQPIVGCLAITIREWSARRNGYLFWLTNAFTDGTYRGTGVASSLFEKAEKFAKSEGAVGLRSYVMLNNNDSIGAQLNKAKMILNGHVLMEKIFEISK